LAPASSGATAATICCDVAGFALVQATPDQIPALRLKPGPADGPSYPAAFLKHADVQTVIGLGAVLHAIRDHGLTDTCFTDWGILGAPRFLGRAALAAGIQRYQLEGPWGISPHLIPHHSLHSPSGTVSQALAIHGPNFGVSGGLHAADETLLVASTLLACDGVPGVWLVLTGHNPEPIPENHAANTVASPDGTTEAPVCRALALGLVAARPGSRDLKLFISPGPLPRAEGGDLDEAWSPFYFEALAEELGRPAPSGRWRLHCGGWVELKSTGAGAEN
jgi:hypothetical protein